MLPDQFIWLFSFHSFFISLLVPLSLFVVVVVVFFFCISVLEVKSIEFNLVRHFVSQNREEDWHESVAVFILLSPFLAVTN